MISGYNKHIKILQCENICKRAKTSLLNVWIHSYALFGYLLSGNLTLCVCVDTYTYVHTCEAR